VRSQLTKVLAVLRYALGPAITHSGRVRNWWPTIAAGLTVVGGVLGVTGEIAKPWWFVGSLVILLALFLRAGVHFYGEAHPDFPRHALTVKSLWWVEFDDRHQPGKKLPIVFTTIAFTNREPDKHLSLDLQLFWTRGTKEMGQILGPYELSSYAGDVSGKPFLESPLPVEPQKTVTGHFAFDASLDLAFEFGPLMEAKVRDGFVAFLRVTDRVTGAAVEQPVGGRLQT